MTHSKVVKTKKQLITENALIQQANKMQLIQQLNC